MMLKKDWFAIYKILYEKQYKVAVLFVPCAPFICISRLTYVFSSSQPPSINNKVHFYKL